MPHAITLVEFLSPVLRAPQRDVCLAVLYYHGNHAAGGPMTVAQIRDSLRQARVKNAKSMNIARALDAAGHLVDVSNAFQKERVWKLTASGEKHIREMLNL